MRRGRTNRRKTEQGESRGCVSDLLNPKRGDKADAEKEKQMTLLEAHSYILASMALGFPELITEAIENFKMELAKRNRTTTQDFAWAYK
jgi:hypothetical protein